MRPHGPSNAAAKGSVVMIYATGGGETSPAGDDGGIVGSTPPRLRQDVTAKIGGLDAPVSYAGAAPYMVSGIVQVNVKIPDDLPVTGPVPVVLFIGANSTQPGVTLTVAGEKKN